jgi:serine/threonine protein kinase, bacterial
MMTKPCPNCNTPVNDTARFCKSCGTQLKAAPTGSPPPPVGGSQPASPSRFCPQCGKSLSLTAKFCTNCSTRLTGPMVPRAPATIRTGKLPPNTLLMNRYCIQRRLGSGGMGAVYLATDSHLNEKLVAVKEMSTSGLQNPIEKQEAVEAFSREAQLLSSLNHQNVPRVMDFFSVKGKQFLVMDYVEGQTLHELLEKRTTPFSEKEVMSWAEQLCNVLTYLHHQSPPVIFRDLKPGNVMVSPDLKHIKLIDFGIVRFFKPSATADTTKLGTPGYAPPEQYGKGGQSDARSDIYALGAMLHFLLTLRDPGDEPFKFPPVKSLTPTVSDHVDAAIAKAVHVNPGSRWQTAEEFRKALLEPTAVVVQQPVPQPVQNLPPAKTVLTPQPAGLSPLQNKAPVPVPVPVPAPGFRSIPAIYSPAPHGKRFGAMFLDSLVLGFIFFVLFLLFTSSDPYDGGAIALLIYIPIHFLYYAIGHAKNGQTFGKKVTGLRVVRMNGTAIGFWRSLWRYIVFSSAPALVSLLFAGFPVGLLLWLIPLLNDEHRGVHDFFSDTKVIEG